MTSLVTSTLGISLTIRQLSGRRMDKSVSEEVAQAKGVARKTGNYWKQVFQCPEYDAITNIAQTARRLYYRLSFPWLERDGLREGIHIMPIELLAPNGRFTTEFRKLKKDWDKAVAEFVNEYPRIVSEQQLRLRGMFNPDDYPPANRIAQAFEMRTSVDPIPTANDFRVKLMDEQMEELRKDLEERMSTLQGNAQRELYNRIEEQVSELADKLGDPNSRLRIERIENLKTLCDDLAVLNFTNDPNIDKLRVEIKYQLSALDVSRLRAETLGENNYRQQATDRANDILRRVRQFGG